MLNSKADLQPHVAVWPFRPRVPWIVPSDDHTPVARRVHEVAAQAPRRGVERHELATASGLTDPWEPAPMVQLRVVVE
eukprot:7848771-Pyramimonas_sp.AAC.1